MKHGILEEIKAAVFRSAEPWFPNLSKQLAAIAWDEFYPLGIVPSNYGTHRCLEKDPRADLQYRTTFSLGHELRCQLEILPTKSRARYEEVGLVFPQHISIKDNVPILQSALSLIASVPNLYATVACFLRSLHVLKPPNKDYDVSHSDPKVPFSIFVSIPPTERQGRLRLAESIVHECMHLQLTVFETLFPLVAAQEAEAYSPWQLRARPITGVIHGLYVFTVIHSWLEKLARSDQITSDERWFAEKRQREVINEAAQVATLASVPGLTKTGHDLIHYLLGCLES